jgi:hypothetical protein
MAFADAHALLIGVGSYANAPQLDLPIAAADARAVSAVLCDSAYCGYPAAQVALLSNATASRNGVLAALDALATRTSERDTVCIFYAGHGHYGDDGYYLTTHDTQVAAGKVVVGTGIREAELIDKLRAIRAKRLLLIVNACHAGELSPVLAAGDEPATGAPLPAQVTAALLGTGAGRVIISACREKQYSFVGPGPLTLFTQALVAGLRGEGVSGHRGYISVFDLYTHLYFALEEAVQRHVLPIIRQRYGEKQEPELTILKGVGPFAVALWRGAATLGVFDESATPPAETAVREVNPAYSQAMLRQYQQQIGSNSGIAIAGDVHGVVVSGTGAVGTSGPVSHSPITTGSGNTVIQSGRDTIQAGGNVTQVGGDYIGGDKVGGDKITDRSVRNVSTGGGDYSEGSIDKRSGTFVDGDQFNMSGDFRGTNLNIKSTLNNVSQHIGAVLDDVATKDQLQKLIAQLDVELQKVPAAKQAEAEQAAKRAEAAVAEALKPNPDQDDVAYSLTRLKKAAENIGALLPNVLSIANQIADAIRKLVGG